MEIWPEMIDVDGVVEIPAQGCPYMGERTSKIYIHFPGENIRANFSRNPSHPNYLPRHGLEIRDPGNRAHIQIMRDLGNLATVVTVHGVDDTACLVADKKRILDNMLAAGLDTHPHYITADNVDGELIRDSGHSTGNLVEPLRATGLPENQCGCSASRDF